MPGLQVGVYPGELTAGTEVSSTGEGKTLNSKRKMNCFTPPMLLQRDLSIKA
ncbi:unnamed protein product, partial [marine sediment metagenome]